jgi:Fic family protein
MNVLKNVSAATASRDLKLGVDQGLLNKKGEHNRVLYYYSTGL